MKTHWIALLMSISLIGQPAMAAYLDVMSWRDAEVQDAAWNNKVLLPSEQGKRSVSEVSLLVIARKLYDVEKAFKGKTDAEKITLNSALLKDGSVDPYGVTPLHYAAARDEAEIIGVLLDNQANINAQDAYGRTPLMWAASTGKEAAVKKLLDTLKNTDLLKRVNIELVDNLGRTALHWAVSKAKFDIVKVLLENDANMKAQDRMGNTPLHYAASIHYRFGNQKSAVTDLVLKIGAFIGGAGVGVAATAAAVAAYASEAAIAAETMAFFTGVTFVPGVAGASAASLAGAAQVVAVVALVIAVIVAITIASMYIDDAIDKDSDQNKRHKIHSKRDDIIKKMLKEDASLALMKNNDNQYPSHFAAIAGNKDPQEFLVKGNEDLLWNAIDAKGFTPLMYACMNGDGANLEPSGMQSTKRNPTHGVSAGSDAQGSSIILDNQSVKFANKSNISPLKLSLMFNEAPVCDALLKIVQDTDIYTDIEGKTILHYAAQAGKRIKEIYTIYKDVTSWQMIDRSKIVFGPGGKVDLANSQFAYVPSNEPMLLAKDIYGATPIHYAASASVDGLKFLVGALQDNLKEELDKKKAKNVADELSNTLINLKDKNGMTPLHYAAYAGKQEAVEFLMKHVKDEEAFAEIKSMTPNDIYGVKIADSFAGKTARDLAQEAGHMKVVKYLSKQMGVTKKEDKTEFKQEQAAAKTNKRERKAADIANKQDVKAGKSVENWEDKAEKKKQVMEDALIEATKRGRKDVASSLIRNGHDLMVQEESTGRTALMYAAEKGNEIIVALIITAARNPDGSKAKALANMKDKKGKTARDLAKKSDIKHTLGQIMLLPG